MPASVHLVGELVSGNVVVLQVLRHPGDAHSSDVLRSQKRLAVVQHSIGLPKRRVRVAAERLLPLFQQFWTQVSVEALSTHAETRRSAAVGGGADARRRSAPESKENHGVAKDSAASEQRGKPVDGTRRREQHSVPLQSLHLNGLRLDTQDVRDLLPPRFAFVCQVEELPRERPHRRSSRQEHSEHVAERLLRREQPRSVQHVELAISTTVSAG